ncbi:transforming acidic coiled-coil protein isoform X2 [Andrena cerasifolii]|uniref:transforming acidic coiled-coil protein isoform X2 n=1 Tax=Andrena cerasifolii TaxID=2819439 RepID=UPI004037D710
MDYINKLLHRAAAIPPRTLSPTPPSGSDNTSSVKAGEHEVKVRFAREFADVGSIGYSAPESLSSASSFQSFSSSLSVKSSSGICADSVFESPNPAADKSYVNSVIPGVEDLIAGCADINLEDDGHQSFDGHQSIQDLSQDQTFTSATDNPIDELIDDLIEDNIASDVDSRNVTQIIGNDESSKSLESAYSPLNCTQDRRERPILVVPPNSSVVKTAEPTESGAESLNSTVSISVDDAPLPHCCAEESNLNSTVCLSGIEAAPAATSEERVALDDDSTEAGSLTFNFPPCSFAESQTSVLEPAEHAGEPSLPSISSVSSVIAIDSTKFSEEDSGEREEDVKSLLARSSSPFSDSNAAVATASAENVSVLTSPEREVADKSDSSLAEAVSPSLHNVRSSPESCAILLNETAVLWPKTLPVQEEDSSIRAESDRDNTAADNVQLPPTEVDGQVNVSPVAEKEEESDKSEERLDAGGVDVVEEPGALSPAKEEASQEREEESSDEKLDTTLTFQDASFNLEAVAEVDLYAEFKPERQSTTLPLPPIDQPNFDEFESASEHVANDIFKSSLDLSGEDDCFVTATTEIFQDPTSFDFLIAHGNSKTINRLRAESLYVKFDPLVSDTSMLPQGNPHPMNEEQNGKTDSSPPPTIVTPKRNPAIAAIDRLLFYSPIPTSMTPKTEEPQEKIEQATEESKSSAPLINDVNISKELELVRATVLQLEEELEKQKKEYEAELERQKNAFQEKINKLQAQIAQGVKSKSEMTVVVDEYEKSISRLLTKRERDRTNFEQDKAKLQEELQATNVHLTNTEAAFNDVHQKYEKLKGVVSVYKNNELVLKESAQENMETIKGLEARYEQLKNYAMAQLEKANIDLEVIRKQHDDETVKLHAMVRKAELKSNSLAELVEQKTKENKELTQILDEVIARVGHQNVE